MMKSPGTKRSLMAMSLSIAAGIAFAAIAPRDLNKQMEFIGAGKGGAVVYGTIVSSSVDAGVPDTSFPWTVLKVRVDQPIAPLSIGGELTVYVPGAGEERLSISPPETETRTGEQVVMFLSANEIIRAHAPGAYKIDSFAEIFRTQTNRQGEVVVLGEGAGSAIQTNVKLSEISTLVAAVYDATVNALKSGK